ncbi:hypothetical protein IVB45_17470 [Bradyrhizobium sp. 4]|uniref:hypothetical protein n=1 Tax=unclassified Bradyrhizobium TaxID=2631580 RepID=UPI001FF8C70E|nr:MULTISPECIES: hypothetical protein [unclassified Bradyrhizobium]MCK1402035.1 hypothetical protein [Bradyrhizobium sp. 39]MCK1751245.1 hypothetical protein [Bradyrhizobium sp. 135]UPJ38499.1 hypothetical protein IVB45_17470 [Bradyrhizobium sp. 4]
MELISISEAARKIGVNKSTLSRQVESGAVRSHDGKVVLAQVLEDRQNNVNLSQSRRRPAKLKGTKAATKPRTVASADATPGRPDATPGTDAADGDFEQQLAEGRMLPFAGAQRVKENYLARQRAVDFEKDVGRLVERAAANKAFFDQARELRDAWLAWPVRVVTLMASDLEVDDRKLVEVLTKYVRQHLDELGKPAAPELAPPG